MTFYPKMLFSRIFKLKILKIVVPFLALLSLSVFSLVLKQTSDIKKLERFFTEAIRWRGDKPKHLYGHDIQICREQNVSLFLTFFIINYWACDFI